MGVIQVCYTLVLTLSAVLSTCARDIRPRKIAVIGEGVIGLSTATAIKKQDPSAEITVFHHLPFEEILSKGIAGLFRIDKPTPQQRIYGNETFVHLAELWRTLGGFSGVQLLSGHILSEDKQLLLEQQQAYSDIVYNFRFLDNRELRSQFVLDDRDPSSAIHYTAFTSEGAKYCPWMKKELMAKGVKFIERTVECLDDLANEGYSIIMNCAGLNGGMLAGNDDGMHPVRGILLKVDAPWQKHFLMRNFTTFTIPTIDAVYVGTVKEEFNSKSDITDSDINGVWNRYLRLQPSFKNVKIIDHFVGLRPGRFMVRVEAETRKTKSGIEYKVVHNYGHAGSGFTLGWGSAVHAACLALDLQCDHFEQAKLATMQQMAHKKETSPK